MKKALPAAIALAGTLGFAAAANAVYVNSDGVGEVLLYSYYTVENGNDTSINITNTTDRVKAVKVRFIESMNSQEVLDFNLYLSPGDVWAGVVTADGVGAKLKTPDNSCTVPAIPGAGNVANFSEPGVPFRNFQYQGTKYYDGTGGPQGLDRTRTGYVEVIEMGVVTDTQEGYPSTITPATWATHVNGKPALCAGLTGLWDSPKAWGGNPTLFMSAPSGGLYGSSVIVNVDGGTAISNDALALDDFSNIILHKPPGTVEPSLENAAPRFYLPDGTYGEPASGLGIDAVSAVLMKPAIANDYLTVAGLNASTDWVITFPTKRAYVNGWTPIKIDGVTLPAPDSKSPEPFTSFWTSTPYNDVPGTACEPIGIVYYDQEERAQTPSGSDFSPPPPENEPFSLCFEANVISINGGDSVVGNGYNHSNLDLIFDAGWMLVNLTGSYDNPLNGVNYDRTLEVYFEENSSPSYMPGLPVIGFAAENFVNGNVGGLLSNYAESTVHKGGYTFID